jgi:hypothetical protein
MLRSRSRTSKARSPSAAAARILELLASEQVKELCLEHSIRELAVFGSLITSRFRPKSDVDLLVEFLPSSRIGYIALFQLEQRLTQLLGRQVQLVSKRGLRPAIRDSVLASAQVVYAL